MNELINSYPVVEENLSAAVADQLCVVKGIEK